MTTSAGKIVTGRLLDETREKLVIQPDPLAPDQVEVKQAEVEARELSKISPMPEHLADVFKAEEILDLIAYLESGGQRNYRSFRH